MTSQFLSKGIQNLYPDGEASLVGTDATSPREFAKALVLGLAATLLVSTGLYVAISGLLVVFLSLVL